MVLKINNYYFRGCMVKAAYIDSHGGPEVLTYGEVPDPVIGQNEVLIKVQACALNRLDAYSRAGARGTRREFSGPHVLGGDISGEVLDIGDSVTQVKVGDRVLVNPRLTCQQCWYCRSGETELCQGSGMIGVDRWGGYSEYVSVPAANVFQIPDNLTYVQAASLPTVFMPSWNIIVRRANLRPWETILVPSASSGVGTAAIQLAKNVVGATTIATTSTPEKMAHARELGADHVLNYQLEDISDRIKEITGGRGLDVVIDHVGTDVWNSVNRRLAIGARYGICGVTSGYKAELQMGAMFTKHVTMFGVFMGRSEDLRNIIHQAGEGTIKGIVHETYPLEDASRAHQAMESLGFFGKLILTMS